MSTVPSPTSRRSIDYPDTDGQPIAEGTLQFDWVVKITYGLTRLFVMDRNVFVAGDLFWYPVEGHPEIRLAPDSMVAFGRPKGHRSSYRQWEEGGLAPQVVFEVLAPSSRFGEMSAKFNFYRKYGVEEYYLLNPHPARLELSGFLRRQEDLVEVTTMPGHISPRLKVRFEMGDEGPRIIRPDGEPFLKIEEDLAQTHRAEKERGRAEKAIDRAKRERARAGRLQRQLDELRRQSAPPTSEDPQ